MASIAQLDSDSAELKKRIERFQSVRDNILAQVRQVIVGQEEVLDQILISLFVGGHCLITGLPGTAKTLMVRTIAQTLGLLFKRIQFTPDLMPSDITGTDIIEEDPTTGHRRWTFVPGPIFGNIVLAEEILDFQKLVRMVPIGESLARYVVEFVRATRHNSGAAPDFVKKYVNYGGSVRAAQFIVLSAKARALTHHRYNVAYEDITALAIPVLRHRIILNFHAESDRIDSDEILRRLLEHMPPPAKA